MDLIEVAAVEGKALGAGFEVALGSNLFVAAADATFAFPETGYGIFPPIATGILPRIAPRRKAMEWILTGNTVSRGGLQGLGSPDVEPEKYLTAEIGTRYGNETLSGSLAVFYTWSEDAIIGEPGPLPNTTVATNGGSGYVYGFEAEGI